MTELPFANLSKKIKTIKVGGKDLLVKPKIEDAEAFMLMKKEMSEVDIRRVTDIFYRMITRAYTAEKIPFEAEDIKDYIAENYGDLFYESSVLFGFMSREELEAFKKKAKAEFVREGVPR
jgi:hypothetical protein